MRCEDIQERFIDFVYDKEGVSPENTEIQEHLRACSACREELEELRKTRKCLQLWKDESPLARVTVAAQKAAKLTRFQWKYVRYAAIAAMLLLCILALANTQIAWNKSGFSLSTHIIPGRRPAQDYYTKAEVVDLMKRALEDSEYRMNELNHVMMQKMLDTVEQERWMDLRFNRGHSAQNQNKN